MNIKKFEMCEQTKETENNSVKCIKGNSWFDILNNIIHNTDILNDENEDGIIMIDYIEPK